MAHNTNNCCTRNYTLLEALQSVIEKSLTSGVYRTEHKTVLLTVNSACTGVTYKTFYFEKPRKTTWNTRA